MDVIIESKIIQAIGIVIFFMIIGLHVPHGPSEMRIKFHGVKMME